MVKAKASTNENKTSYLKIVIGSVVALIVSLVLILLFALLIKWFNWGDGVIIPANIIIKIISMAVGIFIATKDGTKGLSKGIIVGVLYIFLSFLIFSIIAGSFVFSLSLLYDVLLGIFGGGIIGIIAVNIRK
ncbi:MAG: TIGR04086 family membrane protein [Christensenellales bacterium]